MRKLVSKEEEARRKKRNQIVAGVVLALVMILSTISFAFQGNPGTTDQQDNGNEVTYNGYKFVYQNGLWVMNGFVFQYNPRQVEDIEAEVKPISSYQGLPAYVYSEDETAKIEILVDLGNVALRVQEACPGGMVCQGDLPKKTCDDNFIIIKEDVNTSIIQDNNCVYIKGKREDLIKLTDQFLFKTLGVR